MTDLSLTTTFEKELSAEWYCETREYDTEVKWFIKETEVRNGGRYKIQQIGYLRRLVIDRCSLTDSGTVSVVAGADSLKFQFRVKGL